MAVTENLYTGDGSTVLYSFTFPYLEESDIFVSVDGTDTTAYTLPNPTTISFNTAPANGASIRIYRSTNIDALDAEFYPGSSIRAQDLNGNFDQTLYVVQEVRNGAVLADGSTTFAGDLDMGGNEIINLGTPTSDGAAVNKQYVDSRLGDVDVPGHTRWRYNAAGGETSLSGIGSDGSTLQYSATREQVFLNGALLQRGVDYSADDGATVNLISGALVAGDVVDVQCVNNLSTAPGQAADVSFLQSGTGATLRTVESKLSDVVSVKDFGAVGDGVTDDTAAIQAAINYTTTNKKVLVGTAGTYRITSSLKFGSNFHYKGNGAIFQMDYRPVGNNVWRDALFANTNWATTTRTTNIIIDGLQTEDGPNSGYGSHLTIIGGEDVLINNLRFNKTSGQFATAFACDNIVVSNCHIVNDPSGQADPADRLYGDCLHFTQGNNITVTNCILESTSDDGIAFYAQDNGFLVNGAFSDIIDVTVTNCVIKSATNSIRIGYSDSDGASGEYTWTTKNIAISNCIANQRFNLQDFRAQSSPLIENITISNCVFDVEEASKPNIFTGGRTGARRTAYGKVTLTNCTFRGLDSTENLFDARESAGIHAATEVVMSNCNLTGRMAIGATDLLTIQGCNLTTTTSGDNAMSLAGTVIRVSDNYIDGGTVNFSDVSLNNTVDHFFLNDNYFKAGVRNVTLNPATSAVVNGYTIVNNRFSGSGNVVNIGSLTLPVNKGSLNLTFSGSGTPENVVTAPVGSIYTRTDGGSGTTLYVKETGTANTGWVAK